MAEKSEMDDATKLVFEVVEKVLGPDETASAILCPTGPPNDGSGDPRDGECCGGGVSTDPEADLKARPFTEYLNPRSAKRAMSLAKLQENFCRFCKRNKEPKEVYNSHGLYKDGQVSCPVLLAYVCSLCGRKGHTVSHCRLNPTRFSVVKTLERMDKMSEM